MRDEKSVRRETAQERSRNEAPLGKDRCVSPWRPGIHGRGDGWRAFRRSPESGDVEHAFEVGLLFEPCSLTSSELRVDQYELWADGLRLQGRDRSYQRGQTGARGSSAQRNVPIGTLRMRNPAPHWEGTGPLPSKGDRIELLRAVTGVRVRLMGTVFYVDHVQILVKWDDGRSQSLRPGLDRFRIVD
jgi:hypothetical protein